MVLKEIDYRRAGHTQRLKYRGIFDYDGLLKAMRNWLVEQGYEFHERSVKYKVPSPAGAEVELEWEAWKKVSGYVKFWIKTAFHIWDLKEVEVIKDGKKKKMSQGKMLIEIWGQMDLDYAARFSGSKFAQALQDFYHKYVIFKDLDMWWGDELYYRVYKFYSFTKQFLDMEAQHNAAELRW